MPRTGNPAGLCCLGLALALLAACAPAAPAGQQPTEPPAGQQASPTAAPTSAPLPTLTPTVAASVPGLFVDVAAPTGPVSPLVYGSNYGPWLFVPLQMQPYAADAHLTVLRYPGGNWGDRNDMDEWNLDQYIALCRQFGAEPYIHVRLRDGTAEKAAEVVRLMNVEKGYGVRYWSIGNEPNLFGDGYETEQFNREWREWALAMRAVDANIILIGPEINQFIPFADEPYEQELERWMVEFLEANGDLVDIVSFHRYPFPQGVNAGPPSLDDLRASSTIWDDTLPYLRALIREHTGRDLPVAVTEANSSWAASSGGETTLDSHYNAIWWGDSLGRLIRGGAFMVNQFAIAGDFGLMGNYEVRPIYNVYLMYKHFGSEQVFASSADELVSIFAALRDDGALTVMLVNRASEVRQVPFAITGFDLTAPANVYLFDHEHAAEAIPAVDLSAETELVLSPESMLLLEIPAQ